LLALADGQVTFRWRDSADHNRQKVMTVSHHEFLRRFLLHLLPKASSASVTSASSPIVGALLSCRCASLLSTQFHRNPNRNPRPHQPPSPYGAVPNAVDPWPSSNDSPRRNSNSVLHHSWPQLHELIRSHTALTTLQSV
jgi:hypothetical protein